MGRSHCGISIETATAFFLSFFLSFFFIFAMGLASIQYLHLALHFFFVGGEWAGSSY